jgi:hypothetical protein
MYLCLVNRVYNQQDERILLYNTRQEKSAEIKQNFQKYNVKNPEQSFWSTFHHRQRSWLYVLYG